MENICCSKNSENERLLHHLKFQNPTALELNHWQPKCCAVSWE